MTRLGGSSLKGGDHVGGYLTKLVCRECGRETKHLILRRQVECKACLRVRARRDGDPPPS